MLLYNKTASALPDGGRASGEAHELHGTVEELIYTNSDNGYTVLAFVSDADELLTLVGVMPGVGEGDILSVTGAWEHNQRYGRQFHVREFMRELPSGAEAMEKYLASGAIRGIGKKTARRIIEEFGEDAFEIIEHHPDWLARIPGISMKRAEEISSDFREKSGMRTALVFFGDWFGPATVMKIVKRFGDSAVDIAKKHPYILCDEIDGISFQAADKLAAELGVDPASEERAISALRYTLAYNGFQNGFTCMRRDDLVAAAAGVIGVPETVVCEALGTAVTRGSLISERTPDGEMIYIYETYKDEVTIAEKLSRLNRTSTPLELEEVRAFVRREQLTNDITYAKGQLEAIYAAMTNGVMVLTGGPGTGKTTVVRALIDIFSSMGYDVALAAPTGRAAKRLSESTRHEARTVHRLLEVDFSGEGMSRESRGRVKFLRDENNLLDEHIIIVDEFSMMDTALTAALLRAIKPGARLIIIGDADQLPSVGAGNVLNDILASGSFPTVSLSEIFRQAQESLIVTNAHAINNGEMPRLDVKDRDFFFLPRADEREIAETVADLCVRRLPKTYGESISEGIQVITPSRKGISGTQNLNRLLAERLNPPARQKNEYVHRELTFREGDKVMQVKNNYELEWSRTGGRGMGVFNGDIGVIREISKSERAMVIRFDEREVKYDFALLDELEPAYAVTVHKSQGSEYPVVIIPAYPTSPALLTRNMLYTAVTRAQRMVIIVGREDIVRRMVENIRPTVRYTGLARRIKEL